MIGRLTGIATREQPFTYKHGELSRQIRRHMDLVEFIRSSRISLNGSVLDIGCGPGWLAARLYDAGFNRISGCDWLSETGLSPNDIHKFEYSRVDLNAHDLPYPSQSFDVIVCSDGLEHLENPARMLREMERVLSPHGNIFITLPNISNIFERLHFLRTGNSSRYKRHRPSDWGHISMMPTWVLQSLCDRVDLEIVKEGKGYCWWNNHFWFIGRGHNHWFSYVVCYHLKRKADL
jgi:2-polyprenyl-6-hydroxyphenyl methylase/3-demethylubiquinone-9 3-methyltransferase